MILEYGFNDCGWSVAIRSLRTDAKPNALAASWCQMVGFGPRRSEGSGFLPGFICKGRIPCVAKMNFYSPHHRFEDPSCSVDPEKPSHKDGLQRSQCSTINCPGLVEFGVSLLATVSGFSKSIGLFFTFTWGRFNDFYAL